MQRKQRKGVKARKEMRCGGKGGHRCMGKKWKGVEVHCRKKKGHDIRKPRKMFG